MKRFAIVCLLIALFALPTRARADVAPPINPPGSNLQPGAESTQVRMVSEQVLIEVNRDTVKASLGSAHISANFVMRNLGAAEESMAVRFPITANDGRGQYPEITNIVIKVDGQKVATRQADYPDVHYQSEDVPWAEFDVTFPVNRDVKIEVTYNLNGSGYFPYTAFYYILATGAGWKDTIGSADVTLRLPYEASPQNIVLNMQIGWAETTPGGSMQGNEVRWRFENFEPGPYEVVENMEFALVAPSAWQNVLTERGNVAKSPDDGEAWGRLGKAYKDVFLMNKGYREDAGGAELYRLGVEAYERCLALLPNDAEWHAGFAELLAGHAFWDSFMKNPTPETYRALEEIHLALDLAPNDSLVQEIAERISYMFPDGMKKNGTRYDFPWLTATPTPLPPLPTVAAVYDPALLAGTYNSELLSLANGRQARLMLMLGADHSATLESSGDTNQPALSRGVWSDLGDGTIQVSVEDATMRQTVLIFRPEAGNLRSVLYPTFYSEEGLNMTRLVTETPTPAPPPTSAPSQPDATSTPASTPSSPLCGSAAMLPLAAMGVWWRQKRITRK